MILPEVSSLPRRFLLAEFRDGGVLVDVESGDYLHINKSASTICRVLLDPNVSGDAIRESARLLGIDPALAEQHVKRVLSVLGRIRTRCEPKELLQYSASGSGFHLSYDGVPVLHVDPERDEITLVAVASALPAPIESFVRQVMPRVAFLRGMTLLHGAVVTRDGEAVAVCGPSGAGKSTTAGALVDAGAQPIADDAIVVVPRTDHVVVPQGGERTLNAWAVQTTKALTSGAAARISGFPHEMTGPTTRLTGIWFLDRSQRRPDPTIRTERLPPSRVLLRVLTNSFVGSKDWSRYLRATQHLASTTDGYELAVPDTISALRAAARTHTTKVASYLSDALTSDDSQA